MHTGQRPHQESAVPPCQAGQQSGVVRKVCPVSVPVTIGPQVTGQGPPLIPPSFSGAGLGADMAETAHPGIDR